MTTSAIAATGISKRFGSVVALDGVSLDARFGEVMCLLGDNGAGKSTLIKVLTGVHRPDDGQIALEGATVQFSSPGEALDLGVAVLFQDLAMIPIMAMERNFFLGREPRKGFGPVRWLDTKRMATITREQLGAMGVHIEDTSRFVATLSGGQRQALAIARAVYFGAKVLILDEPTSALGVKQAAVVLRYIARARSDGVAIIFITHNVQHAHLVGDRFTVLNHGRSLGTYTKDDVSLEELERMMAGGGELDTLRTELSDLLESGGPARDERPHP